MKFLRKSLLAIAITGVISGCSTIPEQRVMQENPEEAVKVIKQMDDLVKGIDIDQGDRRYMEYVLIPERDDLMSINKKLSGKVDDLKISSAPLHDVISKLAEDLSVGVVFQMESPMTLKKEITINTNNTRVDDYIQIVENTGNIDIFFQGNNMIVSDTMSVSGNFSKLEGAESGVYKKLEEYLSRVLKRQVQKAYKPINGDLDSVLSDVGAEGDSVEIIKEKRQEVILRKMGKLRSDISLGNDMQVEFEPIVVIDETTGAFFIKTEPNLLRNSRELIENVINSSLSYALVQLNIYQVDDQRAKQFGINSERIVNNLYKLSVGSVGNTVAENAVTAFGATATKEAGGDAFSLGITAYEKSGVIRSESNTVVTLFNGVETTLNDTKEVGYWIPGDLKENTNTVNGGVISTFTEDRPEFQLSNVGKTLKIRPRIDQENQVLNMEINYSNSRVYDYNTFEWQRNTQNGEMVSLKNPLKSVNSITGVVFVRGGEYAVLAGTKSRDASLGREGIPGAGESVIRDLGSFNSSSSKTNSLIIVKPVFPNKKSVQLIKKARNL